MKNNFNNQLRTALGTTVLLAMAASGWAAQGRWSASTMGQDPLYSIEVDGVQLLLQCPSFEAPRGSLRWRWKRLTSDGGHSAVLLSRRQSPVVSLAVKQFRIAAGGHTYDGPFDTSTEEGAKRFISLAADLRQGPATVTLDGKTVIFPATDAQAVIPDERAIRTTCNGL